MKKYNIFILSVLIIGEVCAGSPHGIWGECLGADSGVTAIGATVTVYIQTRPDEKLTDTVRASNTYNIDIGNFPTQWEIEEHLVIELKKNNCAAGTEIILNDAGAQRVYDVKLSCSSNKPHGGGGGGSFTSPVPVPEDVPKINITQNVPQNVTDGENDKFQNLTKQENVTKTNTTNTIEQNVTPQKVTQKQIEAQPEEKEGWFIYIAFILAVLVIAVLIKKYG